MAKCEQCNVISCYCMPYVTCYCMPYVTCYCMPYYEMLCRQVTLFHLLIILIKPLFFVVEANHIRKQHLLLYELTVNKPHAYGKYYIIFKRIFTMH